MKTFSITNMDGFAATIRDGAAKSISEEYTENLDEFITLPQITSMIKAKSIGVDDEGLYLITEKIFDETFEAIRKDIYQAGLAKLASKDQIQCAWDSKSNKMIFWIDSKTQGYMPIQDKPNDE